MILKNFLEAISTSRLKLIDLTHKVNERSPTWEGGCGFHKQNLSNYGEDLFRVQQLSILNGIGTHMDAPSHLFSGAPNISDIHFNTLVTPICIVDIREKVAANPIYKLSLEDVMAYENQFGSIPEGSLLVAMTGWSKHWQDAAKYRNLNKDGAMQFPSISPEVAKTYVERLNGIGIDTLSPDGGDISYGFPVHEIMLGRHKWILENLNNLDKMPPYGGVAINLPLNLEGCTESPVRVVGIYDTIPY